MTEPERDPAPGALRPLVPETAASRIADRFVTAIALGQFVPGQKLPTVQQLSQLLEVSPSTVRDGMGRLAALGYVVVRRGRTGGTFITDHWSAEADASVRRALQPQWDTLVITLDLRSVIEQQIARTAAERRTPIDCRHIKSSLRAYERAGRDRESSRLADLDVHQAIAVATHNPRLAELSLRIRKEVSLGFEAEPYNEVIRGRALEQHPLLAHAVIDGEATLAARHAADHFSLTENTLRDLHRRIDPDSAPHESERHHAL